MNMNKINFWESLTISFQPSSYRKIVSQPLGRSFGYLFVFLLLLSAVLSLKYTLVLRERLESFSGWMNTDSPAAIVKALPGEIKIENGQVSTSAKEPFIRQWDIGKAGKQESLTFIIDTTGKVLNLDDYRFGILLTGNKMIVKNTRPGGTAEIKEEDLSRVGFFSLQRGDTDRGELAVLTLDKRMIPVTYESITRWQKKTSRLLPLMIIPLLIYYLIAKAVHLFFFSLMSLSMNDLTKSGLEYKNLLNIGIFALIPTITLALLVQLSGAMIPFFPLIYILVYLIFLFKGIKGSRIIAEKEVPERTI